MNHKSGDIPFEDLSTVETVKDSSLASTPSEKKTSIMGTISGTWFVHTSCLCLTGLLFRHQNEEAVRTFGHLWPK